jgi:hypothetical protein
LSVALIALPIAFASFAAAEEAPTAASGEVAQTLCGIIEKSAATNGLPTGFFTRLIWRESSLRLGVISPAGAQGIAQFMPGTAAERGLADPFDPQQALPESAKFLAELAARFGNLGLAAAAYNAGPTRIAAWLAGQGEPPDETRAFVIAITARPIEEWAKPPPPDGAALLSPLEKNESCQTIVDDFKRGESIETIGASLFAPWGVQLAGNFSKGLALATFARDRQRYSAVLAGPEPFVIATRLRNRGSRAFFRVRLPAPTRAAAQQLCRELHAHGGSCIVLRS